MGGFGSGRRGGKDCTDDMRRLDVRKLQRQRLLTPGNSLTWSWTCNDEVDGPAATSADVAPGGYALLWDAAGEWLCYLVELCSHADAVTDWPTGANGKPMTTGQRGGLTRSGTGWAGNRAS